MLEILYRIYQVATEEERKINIENNLNFGFYNSTSKNENNELLMDCFICDSKEQFKEMIKSEYGENISFKYSKKLKEGDLYCIVIGEHCYDTISYFNKVTYRCDYCNNEVTTYIKRDISIQDYIIKNDLNNLDEYRHKKFCSNTCLNRYIDQEKNKLRNADPDYLSESWIEKSDFEDRNLSGYIYKITKKSTEEFYVGKTIYLPIFRWGQHLKTERFTVKNILDYKFEVLEKVPKDVNLTDRETFWIQKLYKENPEKSLNISQTIQLRKDFESGVIKTNRKIGGHK